MPKQFYPRENWRLLGHVKLRAKGQSAYSIPPREAGAWFAPVKQANPLDLPGRGSGTHYPLTVDSTSTKSKTDCSGNSKIFV